jgi:hypothetical protein
LAFLLVFLAHFPNWHELAERGTSRNYALLAIGFRAGNQQGRLNLPVTTLGNILSLGMQSLS